MPNNDSHHHVVKTTEQWQDRAVEYWVVPRGTLCVELTPEKKTKIKIGEGSKYYSQLPYICDGHDMSNYYTKEETDRLLDNLNRMAIQSTDVYDTKDDLPLDGNKLGDVRFVKSTSEQKVDPDVYLWNGSKWIYVGYDFANIDLDRYLTKTEFHSEFDPVRDKVDEMYPKMHTHDNKDVLDQTERPYTIADKEKLDSLHNYDDTEIRELIHETGHVHWNKHILDTITEDKLWTVQDREKFESLHNYDDTELRNRMGVVESKAHTHTNKDILDQTTAPFKTEDKQKLDSLENYDIFIGTDGRYPGVKGLVPAPSALDIGTFLSSDGTWKKAGFDSDFVGATPYMDGEHGLVPAPLMGEQSYFLRGDGTWAKVKSGGDKYKAGEGIYILSGEVASDTFPFKVYSRAGHLEQYIIYGNTGGVGEAMTGGVYGVNITITDEHGNSSNTSVILPEKISLGDYIDYGRQVFVHMRTNVSSLLGNIDPAYDRRWAIYPDGSIQPANLGAFGDKPQVTSLVELEPGVTYELYHQCAYTEFRNHMNLNVYDTEQNRTRTVSFYDTTGTVPTIIALASNEKYIRLTYSPLPEYYPYTLIRVKAVETPITLPQIPLFPNSINTINVTNTIKPAEIYVEVAEPSEDDPEDPMSDFTGIIYNDGVLDITQEDPTNLAELTVHFRDNVDKTITIPSGSVMTGATTSTDGEEGLVPAPLAGDENKFLRGDGTWAIPSGSVTYAAGDGITFTHPGMTDLGFDFDAFVATITSMHSGTKVVDSEHKVLTLTATADDCYTLPYSQVSAQYVYTFPIVAGHVYRLTWDSSNPSVSGRIFAFENVSETNLHWIDQSVQDYLEFTAVTSGTINFRFGVQNSGNTISYSNIHFYEMDDFDPDTTIINADIAKGLEFDSFDKLQVSLGDGLAFDSNDAIELEPATDSTIGGVIVGTGLSVDNDGVVSAVDYRAGRGINVNSTLIAQPFSYSSFINSVTGVSRGTIVKNNDNSFTITASGDDCFTQPYNLDQGVSGVYIFSPVGGNKKYRLTWTSSDRSISGRVFVFENGRGSPLHQVDQSLNEYLEFVTAAATTSLSFRFGVERAGDTLTYSNIALYLVSEDGYTIEAKLGNGLQFDANGAIEATAPTYTAGTGIQIGGNIIYNRNRNIPSDTYRQVEYLASDGTGYILTDIVPTWQTWYQFRYRGSSDNTLPTGAVFGETAIVNGQYRNSQAFFDYYNGELRACELSGDDSAYGFYPSTVASQIFQHDMVVNFADGSYNQFSLYTTDYMGDGRFANDTLVQHVGASNTGKGATTQALALFAVNTYDVTNDVRTFENRRGGRFYYLNKMEGGLDDARTTHYLLPCYRISDDTYGVYDIKNHVFYPVNDNAGFTVGNDLADIVPVEGDVISAKIGKGLSIDQTYGNITNAGVIDVKQSEENPSTLTVKFVGSQKNITIPGSNYVEGDAISIEHPQISSTITHVKWVLLDTRNRSSAGDVVQVGEFELYDTDDQLLTYSSISATFGNRGTPTYGTNQYQQTPDKLIDGDTSLKMCCTNFTTSCLGLEITMELMDSIDIQDIKQYRYITASDLDVRDPVTWDLYVSSDGTNWTLVDRRVNDSTIPTARETSTAYYEITHPTSDDLAISVKYGAGLALDENGALTVVGGGGTEYDAGPGIEIGPAPSTLYTQVEYLKSTGTQCIRTDIISNLTDTTVLDLKFGSLLNDGADVQYYQLHMFGASGYFNKFAYWRSNGNVSVDFYLGYNWSESLTGHVIENPENITTRQLMTIRRGNTTYGNKSCSADAVVTTSPTRSLSLFGFSYSDSVTTPYVGYELYLYEVKIIDSTNVLIHDLVPVKRNSDDEYGFYDIIDKKFYGNTGTGTFTAGSEVGPVPGDDEVISAKLGVGLTFDNNDAITLDETTDLVFNCDYSE